MRSIRLTIAAFWAAMLLSGVVVIAPASAHAAVQDEPAASATWSVEPAENGDATGDAWTELTLDAGQSVTSQMLITNRGAKDVAFHLAAADGYFTDTGRFNMLPSDQVSVDAGSWISIPSSARVQAGQSAVVSFDLKVPQNATPGDHLAGVAAGIRTGTDLFGVESRVGFRVMVRVRGELAPGLTVTQPTSTYTPSWNPFLPGTLALTAEIVNSGNVRLGAMPRAVASGPFDTFHAAAALPEVSELAPGESRSVTAVIGDVWPSFLTETRVEAVPVPVIDGGPTTETTASAATTVSTIPWSHLLLTSLLLAAATLLLWRGRRKKDAVARMIDNAREEGRREGAIMRGVMSIALALAAAATFTLAAPSSSFARDLATGVTVEIEVTARPTPTATPTSSSSAPAPTPGTSGSPSHGGASHLPQTGPSLDPWTVLATGGFLVVAGVTVGTVAARRRTARPVSTEGTHDAHSG